MLSGTFHTSGNRPVGLESYHPVTGHTNPIRESDGMVASLKEADVKALFQAVKLPASKVSRQGAQLHTDDVWCGIIGDFRNTAISDTVFSGRHGLVFLVDHFAGNLIALRILRKNRVRPASLGKVVTVVIPDLFCIAVGGGYFIVNEGSSHQLLQTLVAALHSRSLIGGACFIVEDFKLRVTDTGTSTVFHHVKVLAHPVGSAGKRPI